MRNIFAAACAALCALVMPAAAQHNHAAPPTASAVDPTSATARAEDIAVFREQFLATDRSYTPQARAEAETRLARLEAGRASVSQVYFEFELARIVALADNGHTMTFAGPRSRRYNRILEVRLAPFGEDFYVLRASPGAADLLGARLVSIDGNPAASVRDVARTLAGGTPALRDRNAAYFLESPEQMQALGVLARADRGRYRFQLSDGSETEREFIAEPANPNRARANADRWFYPQLMAEEGDQWRALLAADQAPWALRDLGDPFRWREAPEIDSLVIELRQNNDSDSQSIASFLREAREAIAARRPANIVLDMRMNGGGDLNTTRDFMQNLPELVPGRIFALTGPWTFSAAISSVGYLEQAAPDRVIIVGEMVGDRQNFWAEGRGIDLPNSGVALSFATERHDYLTGCRGYDDCHGAVRRYPIVVASFAPDIPAPWTIEAYRAGRDPAMEAVAAALNPR